VHPGGKAGSAGGATRAFGLTGASRAGGIGRQDQHAATCVIVLLLVLGCTVEDEGSRAFRLRQDIWREFAVVDASFAGPLD
jgi:hypothetical protein